VFGKQLLGIAVSVQKALFQKIILISLLERAFYGNDIIVQKFEIITPSTIGK